MGVEITLLRLGLATVLGLFIGLERELKHKPLGLKTCIVIAVSSCLLTIISIEAATEYAKSTYNMRSDPMRLAAQIVSGIGFLGAGVILKRGDNVISGITTAAIIWAAAGLGIGVGAGFYLESTLGALFILFSVNVLPYVIKRYGPRKLKYEEINLKIFLKNNSGFSDIMKKFAINDIEIKKIVLKDLPNGDCQMQLKIEVKQNLEANDIYTMIRQIDSTSHIELETK